MQDQYYEEEIDLLDLLYNVLLHFKKIVIVALVGALLGASFVLYRNNNEDKVVEALLVDRKAALEEYNTKISSSDLLAIDLYQNSLKDEDRQEDYLKYAPKLANTVNDYVYEYSANLKITNVTDVNGIINFIQNEVFDDQTLNEIIDSTDFRTGSKYYTSKYFIKELFSLRNISENDVATGDITASRIKTLNFTITASSEERATKIGEEMTSAIMSYRDQIAQEFNSYLYLTNSVTNSKYSPEINGLKMELQSNLSALIKKNEDTLKGFSRIQLKYLSLIRPDLEIEVGRGLTKFTLIGFVVGGFVMCAYFGMIYLLAGKLHSSDEISNKSLKVYGTLITKTYNTWLDKLFKKGNGESLETIINKVKLDLTNNDVKEVVIATSLSDDSDLSNLIEDIKKELSIKEVFYGVTNNENFFKKCKDEVSVIYIEKIGTTKTKDINNLVYTNREFKIDGLGVIVIE